MTYRCDACGRVEESKTGPPKCYCGMPNYITVMKPVQTVKEDNQNLNEYLAE